jgi:hypothetical protein
VLDVVKTQMNINTWPSSAVMWQNVPLLTLHPSIVATVTAHCACLCPSVRELLVFAVLDGGMLCTTGEFSQGNLKELAKNYITLKNETEFLMTLEGFNLCERASMFVLSL